MKGDVSSCESLMDQMARISIMLAAQEKLPCKNKKKKNQSLFLSERSPLIQFSDIK